MTLESVYFLSQIVAAVAIVASLLFVGLQLRHSDKTQRALVHQATIQRTIELNQRLTDAHIVALISKARDPRTSWSVEEIWQMRAIIRVIVLHVTDMQWQHRAGLRTQPRTADERCSAERLQHAAALHAGPPRLVKPPKPRCGS